MSPITALRKSILARLDQHFKRSEVKAADPLTVLFDTKVEKVLICVSGKPGRWVKVGLLYETRPGCWHDLGDVANAHLRAEIREAFGVDSSSARISLERGMSLGSPEAFVTALINSQQ